MGWPKGKPRKPQNAIAPDAEKLWKDIAADRDRILRSDRPEPESRKEGTLRDEKRDDPLPDDIEGFLENEVLEQQLPSPPKKPGWHYFWGSTTNKQTPIQMFIRMGYMFVHPDEIPQWLHMKVHSAAFSQELLQCNEMILMKVPEERYQRIMKHLHHDRPMSEAERLLVNLDMLKKEVGQDSKGNSLVREEGDGLASLVDRRIRSGTFE